MPRNKAPADNVLAAMMALHWAILPDALQTMVSIAERTNLDLEALEKERGQELRNSYAATVRDGVATIPVTGPLFRQASFFSRVSGATSYEDLARDFETAQNDPAVRAILLQVNSPGGSVDGNGEFADMVYAARGKKPIATYIAHQGASAAYLIAAAADPGKVFIARDAMAGSIGTVATVRRNDKDPRAIEIVSTQSPMKRPDPDTVAGRAAFQSTVDAMAQVLVERVATYRGEDVDTVLSDFGQGDVFVGQRAVDAGLADHISDYESVLAELAASMTPKRPSISTRPSAFAQANSPHEETHMAQDSKPGEGANTPAAPAKETATPGPAASAAITSADVKAAVAEGVTAALKADRERIAGITALKKTGNEAMIEQCLADPSCSVNDAKARLYDHEATIAAAKLKELKTDEVKGGKPKSAAAPAEGSGPTADHAAGRKAAQFYNQATGRATSAAVR